MDPNSNTSPEETFVQEPVAQGVDKSEIHEEKKPRGNSNVTIVVLLTVLVLALLGFIVYMFFTDRLDLGLQNPFSQEIEKDTSIVSEQGDGNEEDNGDESTAVNETEPTQAVEKTGKFKVTMTYPSESLPPSRVCFTEVDDASVTYCFVDRGIPASTETYKNALDDGIGTLPVGQYHMAYQLLNDIDYYVWNPCVRELNGDPIPTVKGESKCTAFYDQIQKAYDNNDLYNFKFSYVNSYGGDPIVINIQEGKTTDIGHVATSPYFSGFGEHSSNF